MNHNFIKKLERVLNKNGLDGANGYEIESLISSNITSEAEKQGYDFKNANEYDKESVNVKIKLNPKFNLEVDGSVNRTTKYYSGVDEELPYNQIIIDNIYVVDINGNKKDCNFFYSYQ